MGVRKASEDKGRRICTQASAHCFLETLMPRDTDRITRIQNALKKNSLRAIVCSRPENVLMLTGYWPVMGTSLGIVRDDGHVGVLVPEDEHDLAMHGWADTLHTFQPATLKAMTTTIGAMHQPLTQLAEHMLLPGAPLGFEAGTALVAASYLAIHEFALALRNLLEKAVPGAALRGADDMLADLRSVKTPTEIAHIRKACQVAAGAFKNGLPAAHTGQTEMQMAYAFRSGLVQDALEAEHQRADGFIYCMSGPNSALAYKAYQKSGTRRIAAGDTVLMHCNSYVHGFWTDLTRTYSAGRADDQQRRIHDAIMEARAAALGVIRPGVTACDVDHVARGVMQRYGYGEQFVHPTGHGIGFGANDHNAVPCLHPKSAHVLAAGMVFNVEPAAYIKDVCGLRHCDMVTVTADGMELLSNFQADAAPLIIGQ